ncbi:GNAT family N-acetyltransferase [Rhodobacteraceae bacterium SC52]|nr:GNAT family N-acetyltransferase [Rhodobacteraceae bacterium SC52]
MTLKIRAFAEADTDALWSMLEPAFRANNTYTVEADISRDEALAFWCAPEKSVFMASNGSPVGTYYLKPNQAGGGAHVCNAGFVVHPDARGKGAAQTMLDHALDQARKAGYRAMQFNFVVATNTGAIRIWERNGFDVVGRLPGAFHHPQQGYVDALVMYRDLSA